jgi:hypothetical protein
MFQKKSDHLFPPYYLYSHSIPKPHMDSYIPQRSLKSCEIAILTHFSRERLSAGFFQ